MKTSRLAIFILAVITMLYLSSPACVDQSPIERAVLTDNVTVSGEPETVKDSFAPDIDSIYCSVKLATISNQSTVKAEWYIANSDEAGLKDNLIGQGSTLASTPYIVLQFTRSDKLLPRGDYEVKLYFDGKLIQTLPFKVQGEAAPSEATLSESTLCTSIDPFTDRPLDKMDVFPNDISSIYCSVKLNDADFNTNIKASWLYINGELENMKGKIIANPVVKAEAREYISFSLGMPAGKKLPLGEYSITLFVDDKEQEELAFRVVSPSDIKWPYISEMSTFVWGDADKKSIKPTSQFAEDVQEIDFRVNVYNAPPGTELGVQWMLERSSDGVWFDKLLNEEKIKIGGTGPIYPGLLRKSDPFVKGDYLVRLFIDGQEVVSVPFKVQ